ncbi:MAG: EF2563 family selenium-dependent molybdenum hydroxylase system protein [Treponema sp.]|nr:EF2563 family selenium-dependent molybdenum hydroxylase system protein [Treponema sp.]
MFVIIKGAGDLASGIALRLHRSGFTVVMTETAAPLAVRRTVAFSQAVYDGVTQVEDLTAVLARNEAEMRAASAAGRIAVFVDPAAETVRAFRPGAVVDAIMAKRNIGTSISDAPVVVAIGPGFTAGIDCHAVVETKRGHSLGRVITEGSAFPNTGIPGDIGGFTLERLLRAGAGGVFEAKAAIGDRVKKGGLVAVVRHDAAPATPVCAEIDGIVRGLLPSGLAVTKGLKLGDIDPRCERAHCFTVSDKALAVGGGVLEAILGRAGRI